MSLAKSKLFIIILAILIVGTTVVYAKDYIPTNRDTKLPPEHVTYTIEEPNEYKLLYETENLKYYFKEERDVIAIYDKRNGYTWTTGLDIPFNKDIDDLIDNASEGDEDVYIPKEDKLNTTYTGVANSLLTVEYFDSSNNIKRLSSAAYKDVSSELKTFNESHYRLDINYKKLDLNVRLHIYFDEKGITYEIRDEEIEGTGTERLAAILLTPFMGASGGQKVLWDKEEQEYAIEVPNPMTPGYALVPDGSGALIRFNDNSTSLSEYKGDVFGVDYSQMQFFEEEEQDYIPYKNPMLPVFGVAHGNQQNAFVAYATQGGEYMEIISIPENNMTFYTWVYPRFVYNNLFHQVYNKIGDGYFTIFEERNHFDITMRYDFQQGDGSDGEPSADYVGMARMYREYLVANNELNTIDNDKADIPIRLDFIMSDTKKSILGYEDVIMTNTNHVSNILEELATSGIRNINSGLYGWQRGGITLGKPWKTKWNNEIGDLSKFDNLITEFNKIGIDISLAQDYTNINDKQMNYVRNAAKHVNGWYNRRYINSESIPVLEFSYARPVKSTEWLTEQENKFSKLGVSSMTIDGISNILLSDYSGDYFSVTDSITMYRETLEEIDKSHLINATTPNSYLWKYVDRFLQAPVYSSQFIIQTDTVPFIQMVLYGSMEVYAPYSNFSFYTDKDILRMIDYNVYPSFVLTDKSSHLLSTTNSSNYYSTEYSLYKDLIIKIYKSVNDAMKFVNGSEWLNREVIGNGVILNTYSNDIKIVINYSENEIEYDNTKVKALSYKVLR